MNLFPGKWRDGTFVSDGGLKQALPRRASEGRKVTLGVRPEHLRLDPDGHEATVGVVEPTGVETMVFLRMGGQDAVALFHERQSFRPGEKIRLAPDPERAHLFDAGTGVRLA